MWVFGGLEGAWGRFWEGFGELVGLVVLFVGGGAVVEGVWVVIVVVSLALAGF